MIFKGKKKEKIDENIPYYPYRISTSSKNLIERFLWILILTWALSLVIPAFLIFLAGFFVFTLVMVILTRFRSGLIFYEDHFEFFNLFINRKIFYKEIQKVEINDLGRLFVENKILSIYYIPQDLISSNKKKSLGISNMYINNLEELESMINNKIKSYQ